MNTFDKKSILGELSEILNSSEGKPCSVAAAEHYSEEGSPVMWIVTDGGKITHEYVDGGGILVVPFELRLRYRDIDPSDRIAAAAYLEAMITSAMKNSSISVVDYPSCSTSSKDGYVVHKASLKYTKATSPDPMCEAQNLRIHMSCGSDELRLASYSGIRMLAGGVKGFDFPMVNVSDTGDAAGGMTYTEKRAICARDMEITFDVWDDGLFRSLKDKLVRMMNPRCDLELTTHYMSRYRRIGAHPSAPPRFSYEGAFHRVTLYLTSPYPYFTDGETVRISYPQVTPMLSFPLSLMKNTGAVTSLVGEGTSGIVRNPGDAACPVRMILTANGDVSCPTVLLGGRKIKYLGDLHERDVMEIHSGDGIRMITVNGIVSFDYDRSSRFFNLNAGDNKLVIYADKGSDNLETTFEFEPRYLSV